MYDNDVTFLKSKIEEKKLRFFKNNKNNLLKELLDVNYFNLLVQECGF